MSDFALLRFFSVCSGLLAFSFYVLVIRDAWRKTINPNPTSWLIWGVNDNLILFSSLSLGAVNTLAVPLVYGTCSGIVLFLSLRNERKRPTIIEIFSLVAASVGWLCYLSNLGPLPSLIIGTFVNSLAYIPTIARLSRNSASENLMPWALIWISSIFSIISVEHFRFDLVLFPLDSFVFNFVVIILIIRGSSPELIAKNS